MPETFVVTIARQFGSLGRPIAADVSEALGIEFYDRDIVEAAARKLKLPVSTISEAEESARSSFFYMSYPLGMDTTSTQDAIFEAQSSVMTDLVSKGPCIIVGRCADYVLRQQKHLLNIFLYAPYQARLVNCVERLHINPEEAKKMIASVDRAWEAYHRHYCGYTMDDKDHMHVMLDTSLLGVEGTRDVLVEIIRKRFGQP